MVAFAGASATFVGLGSARVVEARCRRNRVCWKPACGAPRTGRSTLAAAQRDEDELDGQRQTQQERQRASSASPQPAKKMAVPDELEVERIIEEFYHVPHHIHSAKECDPYEGQQQCWEKLNAVPLEDDRRLGESV
ncbi:hypothetical protein FVE85_4190 [Porphyridium purpureum]|uniref:Uncharacterized protein n=1 Tax=Porphyridium purpureum TaxID=35688 RepID=A0A5J4YSK2_PORPP|nr:hypothetical protein FVE85_4190 [Porphyridium purpureum]|eukprot:POR3619..scf229_5